MGIFQRETHCQLCGAEIIENQYGRTCSRVAGPMFHKGLGPFRLPDQTASAPTVTAADESYVDIGVNTARIQRKGADGFSNASGWTSQQFSGPMPYRLWKDAKARRFAAQFIAGFDIYKLRMPPVGNEVHPRFVQIVRGVVSAASNGTDLLSKFIGIFKYSLELDVGLTSSTVPFPEPAFSLSMPLVTTGHWVIWDTAQSFVGQFGTPGTTGTDYYAEAELGLWMARVEGHYWD